MKTVTLVADPYPPYQYEEGETIKGIDQDIISAAFEESRIQTKTRLFPWEVCLKQMEMGAADGIFQITRTPEREKIFLFSDSIRTAKALFFKRATNPVLLSRDKDIATQLKGYQLGVLAGYSYDPVIDQLSESGKTKIESQEALLEALSAGKLDLALIDQGVAAYIITGMQIEGLTHMAGYEIRRQLYVAFQLHHHELVYRFNAGLDQIKAKGLYNQLLKSYGLDY